MLNSKQRAKLKSIILTQDAVCIIGKDGLTPAVLDSILAALTARELIKISVSSALPEKPRAIADELSQKLKTDVVSVIGRKIILYKYSAAVKNHVDTKVSGVK